MSTGTAYREAYPKAGDVALLCEGDLIGYEASILRRWADQRLGTNPLVDIWPCGTAGSIFGISDAIGRARPIMVIEDRDFRTQQEGSNDCHDSKKSRERRQVRVLSWRAWQRNEIENYFLEPNVMLPVMADAFSCTGEDVQNVLSEIIPALSVYQATQYALYRLRRSWGKSDPSPILPSNVEPRPIWNDGTCKACPPNRASVRADLQANVKKWQDYFVSKGDKQEGLQGKELIGDFDAKCDEWENVNWENPTWRIDWSGKEILEWLRIGLTSRYGWRDPNSGQRTKMKWEGLSRPRREGQDRQVEAALRPMLVRQFLTHLTELTDGELHNEWLGIYAK